jgi:hypothetical protein
VRSARTSLAFPAGAPGPPAHATTRPGSHDTWSCACPDGCARPAALLRGFSGRAASRGRGCSGRAGGFGLSRSNADSRRRTSSSRSDATWSRSSPGRERALRKLSRASRTRRCSDTRHPARSASSASRSFAVM